MAAPEVHSYSYSLVAPEAEFSPEFVRAMANRMSVSFHKYGAVADAMDPGNPRRIDALDSLQQRIDLYVNGDVEKGIERGNTEYLIDAANFAMMEFMHPSIEGARFEATDSDGSPGRTRADGSRDAGRNTAV